MKKCVTCKIAKELICFGKNRSTKDSLHTECKLCRKLYHLRNKKERIAYARNYQQEHKKERKLYRQQGHIKEQEKEYRTRPQVKEKRNKRKRERKLIDINYKIRENLRKRLHMAIKFNFKAGSAINDLGCTVEEFKIYIESKWLNGMNWQNWSQVGWHLDHIIPLSLFDLTDREQFLKACHYTNYQLLWAKDNLSKNNKLDWGK